jgi:hypothetical protein
MSQSLDSSLIEQLSPDLFWDVDKTQIDPLRHQKWVITRVVERGRWPDWILVSSAFGPERLQGLASTLTLKDRERNFLAVWLDLYLTHHAP